LHGDGDGDGFEAGDEVEGAFRRDGFGGLMGGDADCEGAGWFFDLDGFWVGLGDRFCGAGDDGEDEAECGFGWGFGGGADFDGGLGEAVGEVVAGFACGGRVVGSGEETAFCVEVNHLGGTDLFVMRSDGGFEVA